MDHFIKEALNACKKHYAEIDEKVEGMNEQLRHVAEGPYTTEYKLSQVKAIREEKGSFCKKQSNYLKRELESIFNSERIRIENGIAGNLPSQDQMTTLSMLRSAKSLSQAEFDMYAKKLKGDYLVEKELVEIAWDRKLMPPKFVDLMSQMERVTKLEKQFQDACDYTGQKCADVKKDGVTYSVGGTGTPYIILYAEKHIDEMIREYEENKFIEPKPEPTYYEQLKAMINKYPYRQAEIEKFMESNRQRMGEDYFRAEFDEFVENLAR